MNTICKVNGYPVSKNRLTRMYDGYLETIENKVEEDISDLEETRIREPEINIKIELLNSIIDRILLWQYGVHHSLAPEKGEVEAEFDYIRKNFSNDMDFNHSLVEINMNPDELKREIEQELTINKVIEYHSNTDDNNSLEEYYKANKEHMNMGSAVRVKHIFVETTESDNNKNSKALQKIQEIEKYLKNGEEFEQIAEKYSECESRENGGEIGFIVKDKGDSLFVKECFKLEENHVSDVFETEHGYHIVKAVEHVEDYIPPFSEIKNKLKEFVKDHVRKDIEDTLLQELWEKADIEYYLEDINA